MPLDDKTFMAPPRGDRSASRRSFLLALSGPQFGELFPLEAGKTHVLGRIERVDILIHDESVSRRHATITPAARGAVLADLGSMNGTFVGNVRITEHRLSDGDRFMLGAHTTLKFMHADTADAEGQRQLSGTAVTDPLTGVASRRHVLDRLASEIQSDRRYLSVLLANVDGLKAINTRYGNPAGDDALRVLGRTLAEAVGKECVIGRFRGGEFLVVTWDLDFLGSRALGERMRHAVEKIAWSYDGHPIALTVSVGCTATTGINALERERTVEHLVAAAEAALRRAKENGSNTLMFASPGA
jgi:two-component system, cell cycle response regulator